MRAVCVAEDRDIVTYEPTREDVREALTSAWPDVTLSLDDIEPAGAWRWSVPLPAALAEAIRRGEQSAKWQNAATVGGRDIVLTFDPAAAVDD